MVLEETLPMLSLLGVVLLQRKQVVVVRAMETETGPGPGLHPLQRRHLLLRLLVLGGKGKLKGGSVLFVANVSIFFRFIVVQMIDVL
jgi:hypothetical protein